MGRIGVDVYPLQVGVPLQKVETFGKYLGGSPTNVAVAAARYGRTQRGDHPHRRRPVRRVPARRAARLRRRRPLRHPRADDLPTPVTFCEIFPPDDFPLYFYRYPNAPDLQIQADELDLDAIRDAGRLLGDRSPACARSPAATATLAALRARGKRGITVLDLDYRPMFWSSREEAHARGRRGAAARHRGGRQPRRVRDRGRRARAATPPRPRCSPPGSSWPSSSRARRACSPSDGDGDRRGAAGAGRGRQRPRRRRRVRRRAVPRPARRLGPRAVDAVLQRRRAPSSPARLACADAMPTADEVEAKLQEAVRA